MKKLYHALVFTFVTFASFSLPAMILAQSIETFEEKKIEQRLEFKAPIEVRIIHNGWNGRNSPFKNSRNSRNPRNRYGRSPRLTAEFSAMINNILRVPVGRSTNAILDEGRQRDAMVQSIWVDQSSARFTEYSQQPPLYAFEVATGGPSSNGQRQSLEIGGVRVRGEFGSAEAVVTVGLVDLVTNLQIAGFVARSTRSSVNLEEIRINKTFHGYRLDNIVNWRLWDTNHDYRREMLSIFQVLENVREQLKTWVIPTIYIKR